MRPIHIVRLDKMRPAVILTRHAVRDLRQLLTVAPVTTTVRGLLTEVPVGPSNGIDHESVVNCDTIQTIEVSRVGRQIGQLHDDQEEALAEAIRVAFDLAY
jgi:mRNA interferase MazF